MHEIPLTMHAMVLTGHGGLEKYEWFETWKTPKPQEDEVLIKVSACGLNLSLIHISEPTRPY